MPSRAIRALQPAPLSRMPVMAMFGLAMIIVILNAGLSLYNGRAREAAVEQAAISRDISNTTNELLAALREAESGQRGFIITDNESYLEPYQTAAGRIPQILSRLDSAIVRRPDQAERLSVLQPVVQDKLREMEETLQVRRTSGFAAAQALVANHMGRNLMARIQSLCDEIHEASELRVVEFTAEADAIGAWLRTVSTFGGILLLAFIAALSVAVFRSLKHRERLYEEALHQAERFRVTLASIGDGVIATDEKGVISFMNPVASRLTGWSESDAMGLPIGQVFSIVNETTRATVENPVEQALATGTVVGLANHTVLIAKGGSEIPIDDSGAPIQDRDGSIVGAILVFRDITQRRDAERQMHNANQQLQDFVNAAAHDLRAAMRSINTFTELLSERNAAQLDEGGKKCLRFITSGVRGMEMLLRDLLAYAQASHFETDNVPEHSMAAALHTSIENLRADLDEAHGEVTADELPAVPVRSAHLVQLFQNLIGNALKYRGPDPPRVRVQCNRRAEEWVVSVHDNGIGIEREYAEYIFKPFTRLHGSNLPGTGIGLAICQKIVAGYGGRIWVESVPSKGSTFLFTIPTQA